MRKIDVDSKVRHLHDKIDYLDSRISELKAATAIHNIALARIIAKLDPLYGVNELDSKRVADSNLLGQTVLEKIKTEALAQAQGEPEKFDQLQRYFRDTGQ